MRKATMVFEKSSKSGNFTFLRGRVQEKGRRWGGEMTIGRSKFEHGKEYEASAIVELTNAGIRVSLDPTQPERQVVLKNATWKDAKIEVAEPTDGGDEAPDA